jgi:hypothetical protein
MLPAVSGAATSFCWRCYNRLKSISGAASITWRPSARCFNHPLLQPPAPLLPTPGAAATTAQRRCYKPPAALLQSSDATATILRRRCYKMSAALLQSQGGAVSSSAAATIVRRRCYKPAAPLLQLWARLLQSLGETPPALLQSSDDVATIGRCHSCMGWPSVPQREAVLL